MASTEAKQSQIEGIATLLVLNDELRKVSNIREFGFFCTNETHRLLPYHTAYLWQKKPIGGVSLVAQSGSAEIDEQSPHSQWLKQVIEKMLSDKDAKKIHQIDQKHTDLESIKLKLSVTPFNSKDEFPQYLLWCPYFNKNNEMIGGLVIFREHSYSESEIKMINWLISSHQYTFENL